MTDDRDAQAFDSETGGEIVGELTDDDPVGRAVFIALDEAASKITDMGQFDPFLFIVQGDDLHVEEQEGDDQDEVMANVRKTIYQMQQVADAYVFAFDGFVELDDGPMDAIIVEYARIGDDQAQVLGWLYHWHDDEPHFVEPMYSLGTTEVLFTIEDVDKNTADPAASADAAADEGGDAA